VVKRFTWDENEGGWTDRTGEIFKPQEELVRASDYDALAERLAEAERLLEEARTGAQLHWSRWKQWREEVDAFMRPTVSASVAPEAKP
jgi:glucose-6-phosphate dehydrogenase assembly protein OpcA